MKTIPLLPLNRPCPAGPEPNLRLHFVSVCESIFLSPRGVSQDFFSMRRHKPGKQVMKHRTSRGVSFREQSCEAAGAAVIADAS